MKTEDVRMTEIAVGPYTTLILFSVPERATAVNQVPHIATGEAPIFTAAMLQEVARREENLRLALAHEV